MPGWEAGKLGGQEAGRLGSWEIGRLGGWGVGFSLHFDGFDYTMIPK